MISSCHHNHDAKKKTATCTTSRSKGRATAVMSSAAALAIAAAALSSSSGVGVVFSHSAMAEEATVSGSDAGANSGVYGHQVLFTDASSSPAVNSGGRRAAPPGVQQQPDAGSGQQQQQHTSLYLPLPSSTDAAAMDAAFEAFAKAFGRPYAAAGVGVGKDDATAATASSASSSSAALALAAERARRRAIFEQNVLAVMAQQALNPMATYGLNAYSDEDMGAVHSRRRAAFIYAMGIEEEGEDAGGATGGNNATAPASDDGSSGQQRRGAERGSEGGITIGGSGRGRRKGSDPDSPDSFLPPRASSSASSASGDFPPLGADVLAYNSRAQPFKAYWDSQKQQQQHEGVSSTDGGVSSAPHYAAAQHSRRRLMDPAAMVDAVIDWRTYNAVSPVKNQGNCGSCWSFAVTGNVESLWIINGNNATLLSEEMLIACDDKSGNDGCNGGLMQAAYWWLRKYHDGYLATDASYPFTSGNGVTAACNNSRAKPGAYIYNWGNIQPNENALMSAVSQIGPVAVGIDSTSWDFYQRGIMTSAVSRQLDHAALVVGYDTTNTPPYWIVKNSWGTSWGEDGYLRIQMGKNLCLIADIPCTGLVPYGPTMLPAAMPRNAAPPRFPPFSMMGGGGKAMAVLMASVAGLIVPTLLLLL